MDSLDVLEAGSLKPVLEAMLLVTSDPVSAQELSRTLEVTPAEVSEALRELAQEYTETNRGFQLREVAGGWRMYTHPAYHDKVEAYVMSWDTRRLSQAALEALAVIAYNQPVTREGVRAIRGVNSDGVISSLVDKGLVRELGRETGKSQAILYGTTRSFLEHFGLKSLAALPDLEEFAPDERSKQFIRERLGGHSAPSTLEGVEEELEVMGEDGAEEGELTRISIDAEGVPHFLHSAQIASVLAAVAQAGADEDEEPVEIPGEMSAEDLALLEGEDDSDDDSEGYAG